MRTDGIRPVKTATRAAALVAALLGIGLALPASAPAQERVITGDHVVEEGTTVDAIAVVGGDLTVRGEVTGDAVVVGGNLIVPRPGVIRGDAMVTGGEISLDGGSIEGEMKALNGATREAAGAAAAAAVSASQEEGEARRVVRVERERDRGSSWFRSIREGFAELISAIAFGLVLAGIGAVLIFYGRPYLETVSDTIRVSTVRSAAVGIAAGFLVIPAFVVMVVALAVSIIGIPVLILAVPAYPLVIFAAAALGLLGAAHAMGERTAEQNRGSLRGMTNSYSFLFTGIAMLMAPLILGSLFEMTGFLGFLGDIIRFFTWAVIWLMTTAGFGAVILSRGGTRRTFAVPPIERALDMDTPFDDDVSTSSHS